jgi:hypothetical protein
MTVYKEGFARSPFEVIPETTDTRSNRVLKRIRKEFGADFWRHRPGGVCSSCPLKGHEGCTGCEETCKWS